jgi:hypothetical protein
MFISLCNATGAFSLPSHDTLAVWATQSTFLERGLVHSAKRCCLQERLSNGNALDGSDDDILWEDDGEDKDDNDWVTDNDSVMSDDGESEE